MIKKHWWKLALLAAIVLLVISFYYAKRAEERANEGVIVSARSLGPSEARVVLVEYSDFQCPACAQFSPYLKEMLQEHGTQIRLEYRHYPLINTHPYAIPAAIAAEAAGVQGKFWEMHDKLFENQNAWSRAANPQPFFVQYVGELGLDVERFKRHLGSSLIADAIEKSYAEAQGRGLSSTPSFLLNGEVMEFKTFEEFRQQIEAAIQAAGTR